jgi:hypothetical protein
MKIKLGLCASDSDTQFRLHTLSPDDAHRQLELNQTRSPFNLAIETFVAAALVLIGRAPTVYIHLSRETCSLLSTKRVTKNAKIFRMTCLR